MLDGVHEEHKVHLAFAVHIVLVEVTLQQRVELLQVRDLLVEPVLPRSPHLQVVPKEDLAVDKGLLEVILAFEPLLGNLVNHHLEVHLVLIVD